MGAITVIPGDFIGQYKLAKSTSDTPIIQSFITREWKKTLYKLLGKELADLLIAYNAVAQTSQASGALVIGTSYYITTYVAGDDFTNVGGTNTAGTYFIATGTTPTSWASGSSLINKTERYENIINPFYLESLTGFVNSPYYDSNGIKDLLLIQVYYCYLSENQIQDSQSGVVGAAVENGSVQSITNAFRMGEIKWNEAGLSTYWAIQWYCSTKYPAIYPEFAGVRQCARNSAFL